MFLSTVTFHDLTEITHCLNADSFLYERKYKLDFVIVALDADDWIINGYKMCSNSDSRFSLGCEICCFGFRAFFQVKEL